MIEYPPPVNALPVILLAAAGVGFGHAVMPDHWLPLAVVARARRYRTSTVARLSLAAGLAHVAVSLLLGAIVIGVGLRFRTTIAHHTDLAVGGVLLATGAVFLLLELSEKGHGHRHDQGHSHGHGDDHGAHSHHAHDEDGHVHDDRHELQRDRPAPRRSGTAVLHRRATTQAETQPETQPHSARGLAPLLVPFGAAASPDLTILPVFLAASALGAGAAVGSLVVFAAVTVVTIVGLTVATALGARLLTASWVDRSANLLTTGTLLLIGALVMSGLI
jgi:nickel/cobalt transporter (NicO) family protein